MVIVVILGLMLCLFLAGVCECAADFGSYDCAIELQIPPSVIKPQVTWNKAQYYIVVGGFGFLMSDHLKCRFTVITVSKIFAKI